MAHEITNGARPYEKRARIPLTGQGFTKTQVRFLEEWGDALRKSILLDVYAEVQKSIGDFEAGRGNGTKEMAARLNMDEAALTALGPEKATAVHDALSRLNPADAALSQLKEEPKPDAKPDRFVADATNTPTATPIMLEMINAYEGELQAGLRRIAAKDSPAASRIPEMKNFIANFRP